MSLLRHTDKSFRNTMATWRGSQRSQAALICRAGMISPPQPPWTAPLPPRARVSGGATGADANPRTGCRNGNKQCFKKKNHQPTLMADLRGLQLCSPMTPEQRRWGCLGTSVVQLPPDRQCCPGLPAQGLPEVRLAFPCTGSCDGYVRQNQVTPKYGLAF